MSPAHIRPTPCKQLAHLPLDACACVALQLQMEGYFARVWNHEDVDDLAFFEAEKMRGKVGDGHGGRPVMGWGRVGVLKGAWDGLYEPRVVGWVGDWGLKGPK